MNDSFFRGARAHPTRTKKAVLMTTRSFSICRCGQQNPLKEKRCSRKYPCLQGNCSRRAACQQNVYLFAPCGCREKLDTQPRSPSPNYSSMQVSPSRMSSPAYALTPHESPMMRMLGAHAVSERPSSRSQLHAFIATLNEEECRLTLQLLQQTRELASVLQKSRV